MAGQFAAYETAFTRLSRVQCRSLLITEGFIDPGFVWPEIEDRRNWRSVLHALYRNDGLFDPKIPLNEHLAFDTNGAWPRGAFIKDGQHWSPPQVSAYFANSYGANPVEYLANFFGRTEAQRLAALPTPQTTASEAGYQGDFVVMTNKPFREPNGPVSDRFSLALKAACTNPTSGWVDQMTSPVPPGDRLDQVKIVPNGGDINEVKQNFENRWFLFGTTQYHSEGESKAPTVDSININGLMALQRTDGSFAGFHTGDQVVLLDVSSIRRGMKVLNVTDDLIITDGTFKAFTDGRVISCADQIAGFCTHYDTATQVATFEPRLARVPRHHQHVGNIGQSDADDGKLRDIELLAQMLVDTPFESRQLVMNASLGVESDASRPLKFSDVSGYGVGTLKMDEHASVRFHVARFFDELWQRMNDLGDPRLRYVFFDWEGYAASWNFSQGQKEQLVEEFNLGLVSHRFGFPVEDFTSLSTGVGKNGEPVTEDHAKVWAANIESMENASAHVEAIAASVKSRFPECDIQAYQNGSCSECDALIRSPHRSATIPYGRSPNWPLASDVLSAARSWMDGDQTFVDTANPVAYEPGPNASVSDAGRYSTIANAFQIFQASPIGGVPTLVVGYGYQDDEYHGMYANTPFFWDWLTHQFFSCGVRSFTSFNERSTDDVPVDKWAGFMDELFPTGDCVPVPMPYIPAEGFVRSRLDNAGRFVDYFTPDPDRAFVVVPGDDDGVIEIVVDGVVQDVLYDATILMMGEEQLPNVAIEHGAIPVVPDPVQEYVFSGTVKFARKKVDPIPAIPRQTP